MKLIVGLGNPGLSYAHSRHNLGALVVKKIAKEYNVKLKLVRSLKSRVAQIEIKESECILAMPNTFMNLSGEAVSLLMKWKEIPPRDLLIIHDDIDLKLGAMRFKKNGGSGGHNGIESVIKALNTQSFNRLKLGIGRNPSKENTKDYVLSVFSRGEQRVVNLLIKKTVSACQEWVKSGIDRAMNKFNQAKPKLMEQSEHKFVG